MNIINLDQLISMTSVEIAELTGKEHRNVLRDIRNMVEELNALKTEAVNEELNGSKFGLVNEELNALKTELVGEEVYKDAKGESRTMYRLDRKHTFILVAGYSVHLRAKCYDHIQTLERRVLQLEDQKKRAAIQSANRRGVTWGDYCKANGLPAQKLMTILKKERKLFRVHPFSGEWSVNPNYVEYFRIIKPTDHRFNPNGINIRFNAKGLEFFSRPENVLKMHRKVIAVHGSDATKQQHIQAVAKLEGR
ncbi:Rha family transcriptional regulator [Escherichia coli]|uniref:Rha family transcriptional regulator n=1 Tax=Escherichia coli TaxID=562 RepID=UPI000699AFD4|nr:Rha family transcriptional regulator [Escherichia coli]EFH7910346.1 Rha family transcriptional regulator [Escherichia coli O157:H7]EHW2659412.1 Rha family transcriptional regulator [Escherichia coli]EHW3039351.1 Rha family transcriptional regulator [Escherichia coli]EIZ9874934.1 Rha family transcriptional regulator [Escherichia coli]HCS6553375.1 Rha family transcriptional regulator [Escherichia coli]